MPQINRDRAHAKRPGRQALVRFADETRPDMQRRRAAPAPGSVNIEEEAMTLIEGVSGATQPADWTAITGNAPDAARVAKWLAMPAAAPARTMPEPATAPQTANVPDAGLRHVAGWASKRVPSIAAIATDVLPPPFRAISGAVRRGIEAAPDFAAGFSDLARGGSDAAPDLVEASRDLGRGFTAAAPGASQCAHDLA